LKVTVEALHRNYGAVPRASSLQSREPPWWQAWPNDTSVVGWAALA
jgi:hypothetical protein